MKDKPNSYSARIEDELKQLLILSYFKRFLILNNVFHQDYNNHVVHLEMLAAFRRCLCLFATTHVF